MVGFATSAAAQVLRYAYAHEQVTVSSTATSLTAGKVNASTINRAQLAIMTINCASGTSCVLRFTIDGTTPTASLGLRALYGDTITISANSNIAGFKGIRETSTDVVLDVTYLR